MNTLALSFVCLAVMWLLGLSLCVISIRRMRLGWAVSEKKPLLFSVAAMSIGVVGALVSLISGFYFDFQLTKQTDDGPKIGVAGWHTEIQWFFLALAIGSAALVLAM